VARDIKVHTGTCEETNGKKRPAAWVVTSVRLELEPNDLIDGLGSKFFRYDIIQDDETERTRPADLPVELSQADILRIYRDEFFAWGKVIETWGEELDETRHDMAQRWLGELVVNAFPEMKGYLR
jgi:hypothetical protein